MAAKKTDKPTAPNLNLDTLERESSYTPFVFTLAGKRYETRDVEALPWQDVQRIADAENAGDVVSLLQDILGEDQWAEMTKEKLPMWKLAKLLERIGEHNRALVGDSGESDASGG